MERLNNKTLSFSAMSFTRVIAALGIVLSLAACGNEGSGGGGTPAPVPTPTPTPTVGVSGCTNCGAITQPTVLTTFRSAFFDPYYSNSVPAVEMVDVQVFGNAAQLATVSTGNYYYQYEGPIAILGTLKVAQTRYDNVNGANGTGCVLPAGQYAFQTTNVGQMSYNGYNIYLPLVTTTSGGIEFKIEAPSYYPYGMGFLNQGTVLNAYVSIMRINGVTCSSAFHYVNFGL